MALQSVATDIREPLGRDGKEHDLWLSGGKVLTIELHKESMSFPPAAEHHHSINEMIQDLARAMKSVVYHAENDVGDDTLFLMQPVEGIADAIIMLSQLSDAISKELEE